MSYMVIDTETTISEPPKVYNVAWQITTNKGFKLDEKDLWLPGVLGMVKPKTAKKTTKSKLKRELQKDEKKVSKVFAYNAAFDQKCLKADINFEFEKPVKDLWTASCQYICGEDYIKWAKEKNKLTKKGNIKTSAETVYQYISGIDDFKETHKAAEDVQIEKEILKHLLSRGENLDCIENEREPWKIVRDRKKQLEAKENVGAEILRYLFKRENGMEEALNGRR